MATDFHRLDEGRVVDLDERESRRNVEGGTTNAAQRAGTDPLSKAVAA